VCVSAVRRVCGCGEKRRHGVASAEILGVSMGSANPL
jgi:hypothetical protein